MAWRGNASMLYCDQARGEAVSYTTRKGGEAMRLTITLTLRKLMFQLIVHSRNRHSAKWRFLIKLFTIWADVKRHRSLWPQYTTERRRKSIAEKRKTTTSTDVKRRYNERVYARIYLQLPRDIVTAFKSKCKAKNISQASVLLDAIEKFLGDNWIP